LSSNIKQQSEKQAASRKQTESSKQQATNTTVYGVWPFSAWQARAAAAGLT